MTYERLNRWSNWNKVGWPNCLPFWSSASLKCYEDDQETWYTIIDGDDIIFTHLPTSEHLAQKKEEEWEDKNMLMSRRCAWVLSQPTTSLNNRNRLSSSKGLLNIQILENWIFFLVLYTQLFSKLTMKRRMNFRWVRPGHSQRKTLIKFLTFNSICGRKEKKIIRLWPRQLFYSFGLWFIRREILRNKRKKSKLELMNEILLLKTIGKEWRNTMKLLVQFQRFLREKTFESSYHYERLMVQSGTCFGGNYCGNE